VALPSVGRPLWAGSPDDPLSTENQESRETEDQPEWFTAGQERAVPNATLVNTRGATERISRSVEILPKRLRWVHDDELLHVGDRTLVVLRLPVYDSPTTRALRSDDRRALGLRSVRHPDARRAGGRNNGSVT
jgi:hypothetical protein